MVTHSDFPAACFIMAHGSLNETKMSPQGLQATPIGELKGTSRWGSSVAQSSTSGHFNDIRRITEVDEVNACSQLQERVVR